MRNRERLMCAMQWSLCFVTMALLVVSANAVIPPVTETMLAFRIAATEGGLWFLVVATIAAAVSLMTSPRPRVRIATGTIALITGVLVTIPMLSIAPGIRRADASFQKACGTAWLDRIPIGLQKAMRPGPFSARDAFLGIPCSPVVEAPIIVPSSNGLAFAGITYQQAAPGSRQPVVIAIHGGGWRGGSIKEGAPCHRYLAAHGYLVYAIDYRSAPDTRFPGQLDDVNAALEWVSRHATESGGDPSQLILLGRSAGAELAMIAAYAHLHGAIRAVVSWYGPVDLDGGYRDPPRPDPLRVRTLIGDYLGGTPDEKSEAYARASPITYATTPLPPTLLIAGGADHGVLIDFQRRMRDRLAITGTTVVLLELPWAEHAFDRVVNGPGAQVSLYYLERFLAWAVAQ